MTILREDITLFDNLLLAEWRASWREPGDERRETLLNALRESAHEQGWGEEPVELGVRLLEFESGNWPGYGDAALIVAYMEPSQRAALTVGGAALSAPVLVHGIGLSSEPFDALPADVFDALAGLLEVFAEGCRAAGDAPALWVSSSEEPRIDEAQARIYLQHREGGRSMQEAAAAARIAMAPEAMLELAVLERGTAAGMAAMLSAAQEVMTWRRYQNLALGVFRYYEVEELPEYILALALKEMMSLGHPPWTPEDVQPLPWPHQTVARAVNSLARLRAHLIQADVRPQPLVEDVAPVYGEGTVETVIEVLDDEGNVAAEAVSLDDPAGVLGELETFPEGNGEPPGAAPPPLPPPPLAGAVGGAVVELLDEQGNVVEAPPPGAPPPPLPPEPRLYTGAEMAEMGSFASLENMTAVLGRAISGGTVLSSDGSPCPIDVSRAAAWCAVDCVDAIVRILPAQIRDGEVPAPLSKFASSVLGLLLVTGRSGLNHIGRKSGSRTAVRFPCLTAETGVQPPLCTVSVWSLAVLERAAQMGAPMLAFASEKKLAEIGEEDPGGFMGELAHLAAVARSLEAPAVTSGAKLSALRRFFDNN